LSHAPATYPLFILGQVARKIEHHHNISFTF
jgi:hypothetical protein